MDDNRISNVELRRVQVDTELGVFKSEPEVYRRNNYQFASSRREAKRGGSVPNLS